MKPYWLKVFSSDLSAAKINGFTQYRVEINREQDLNYSGTDEISRISPIFPVKHESNCEKIGKKYKIIFFCFDESFSVLGRVLSKCNEELSKSIYCSLGIASIILIINDDAFIDEFLSLSEAEPKCMETWVINNSIFENPSYKFFYYQEIPDNNIAIAPYGNLPVVEKAMIDEFVANISLILPRVSIYMPQEVDNFIIFINLVNELIKEIVYLNQMDGQVPETLMIYSYDDLKNNQTLVEKLKHQAIDKIIQINSSLSYFSIQVSSGGIPILERRSLIRRYSLLGIGTAIMALTKIARSIENAFYTYPVEDIIFRYFSTAKPLPPVNSLYFDASIWEQALSVNTFERYCKNTECTKIPKLTFFSYRLGFRETEFSVSVAIQSLTGGSGLEWSLLTLTHEILHGQVRKVLAYLMLGDKKMKPSVKEKEYYQRFIDIEINNKLENVTLIDSIRNILFYYCNLSYAYGSLTRKIFNHEELMGDIPFNILNVEDFWPVLREENRNISEIFVHILDYYYFYDGRLRIYIPLIWKSWNAVPHVYADLRQYVLRSLLIIAAKENVGQPYIRFKKCVDRFIELLSCFNMPLNKEIFCMLEENHFDLWSAFKASLILVDLVKNVFVSKGILSILYDDSRIHRVDAIDKIEDTFEYRLSDGFFDEAIKKPAAYILDQMEKSLYSDSCLDELEFNSVRLFLSCASANEGWV